jgi:ornithine cyclodeaminase/alanine dehydrogenase
VKRVLAWDIEMDRAREFARDMREALALEVTPVDDVRTAALHSDIIVTATSSQTPFLAREFVSAGTFVAAVGADSPEKNELAPELLAGAKIVVDVLAQCVVMGDLHHAIDAGRVTTSDVHADLSDLVTGRKPGRTDMTEITVFDSTGFAIEDTASAAYVYQRAIARNVGTFVPFGAA